jgi:hypothetical protein
MFLYPDSNARIRLKLLEHGKINPTEPPRW